MTDLKKAAIRLYRVHKLMKRDYRAWKLVDKYLKKGYLDYNRELMLNRQTAVTAWEGLTRLESDAIRDVQLEVRNVQKSWHTYAEEDGLFGLIYIVGAIAQMFWDLSTALIFGC